MRHRTWLVVAIVSVIPVVCLSSQAQIQVTSQNNIQVDSPALRQAEPPSATASAEDLELTGDQLRAKKAQLDALDYYRAALRKVHDKSVLYNKIGIVELTLHRWNEARADFDRALKANKKMPEANNNLGVVLYLNHDYSAAIRHYRKAINLSPDSASFYNNLGAAYFEDQDFKRAAQAYHTALELDPDLFERTSQTGIAAHLPSPQDRAHYFYVIAQMYAKMGQAERSILYLRKSMEDGYKDIDHVYRDEEFAMLRKTPEFNSLMSSRPVSIQ